MEQTEQNKSPLFFFALFVVVMALTYKITVWDPYFAPAAPAKVAAVQSDQGAAGTATPTPAGAPQLAAAPVKVPSGPTVPSVADVAAAGSVSFKSSILSGTVSLLGGRLTSIKLAEHGESLGEGAPRLDLVSHLEGTPYPLGVYTGSIDDSAVLYSAPGSNFEATAGSPAVIPLTGVLPDGRTITKTFTVDPTGYFFGVSVQLSAEGAPVELEWSSRISKESPSWVAHDGSSGYVSFDGAAANRVDYHSMIEGKKELGLAKWVALSEKYFSTGLINVGGPSSSTAIHQGENFRVRLLGAADGGNFRVFTGPNSYSMLKNSGDSLELILNLGRLSFLCAPILSLLHLFFNIFANYGLAIVALTIVVKIALLPLTAASFKSMQAMQDIQPEVQRLRETVTDKQQQQLQLMELYKKRGVNPLGGCLPMLLQLPIFIGLYTALNLAVELRHAEFALWINDLSAMENLRIFGIRFPMMVILLTLSMLIQQWTTPSTMDPTQKKIMMVMPLVFGFMFMNFPAGLTLYWLVGNIISIAQMKALRGSKRSPFVVTGAVSLATFAFAFILTKI